jgi:hypothetical protein
LGYWLFVIVFAAIAVWGTAMVIHWLVTPADARPPRDDRPELQDEATPSPAHPASETGVELTD